MLSSGGRAENVDVTRSQHRGRRLLYRLVRPALNKAYPAEDKPHLPAYSPVATSQSLTVLSPLTEAKVLPSGLNATE